MPCDGRVSGNTFSISGANFLSLISASSIAAISIFIADAASS